MWASLQACFIGRDFTEKSTGDTAQEVTPWKRTPKMPKETGNGRVKV